MYVVFGFFEDQGCTLYFFQLGITGKGSSFTPIEIPLTVTLNVIDIFQLLNLIVLDGG